MSLSQQPGRGDEVMADLPFEGVISGVVVDVGPRYTIRELDTNEHHEVDEEHVWRNGYSVTELTE